MRPHLTFPSDTVALRSLMSHATTIFGFARSFFIRYHVASLAIHLRHGVIKDLDAVFLGLYLSIGSIQLGHEVWKVSFFLFVTDLESCEVLVCPLSVLSVFDKLCL